jgi:hypothetical protein
MGRNEKDKPPEQFCPEKGCGKKMAAFKRGGGWKYLCPDAGKHAQEKATTQRGTSGKGGVKKGTPSPRRGRLADVDQPYRTRYDWRRKPKDKDEDGK